MHCIWVPGYLFGCQNELMPQIHFVPSAYESHQSPLPRGARAQCALAGYAGQRMPWANVSPLCH